MGIDSAVQTTLITAAGTGDSAERYGCPGVHRVDGHSDHFVISREVSDPTVLKALAPHVGVDADGRPEHVGATPPWVPCQLMNLATKLNQHDLAQPVDRKKALRRSRYDVRTLARDVLLATGKHPDLLPLNGHLEVLRNMFTNSINFNSDLSTVRWDLIDPGEQVVRFKGESRPNDNFGVPSPRPTSFGALEMGSH